MRVNLHEAFKKDAEWQKYNQLLHLPDLTYRERDAFRATLDTIEDRIRKEHRP